VAGKVTVGLASHWPCITDNSGITTYRLMALEREMSTPHNSSRSMAHFTFTFYNLGKLTSQCQTIWILLHLEMMYAISALYAEPSASPT